MEDLVTYELAVKLKELGYNIPFFFFYRTDDKLIHHAMVNNSLVYGENIDDEVVIAPAISQVLKWLREEKEIDIIIDLIITYNYNLERIREYSCRIYTSKLNKPKTTYCFKSFEQAAIDGIKYVIDNLI